MDIVHFASESYPESARARAWREALSGLALQPVLVPNGTILHATASIRSAKSGLAIGHLAGTAQTIKPVQRRFSPPIVLLPIAEAAVLKVGDTEMSAASGDLIAVCAQDNCQAIFGRGLQAIVLSISAAAFSGNKLVNADFGGSRILPAKGLAAVVARILESTADGLHALTVREWAAIEQSLPALLRALLGDASPEGTAASGSAGQAALLNRIHQTIERWLDDAELSPARVAEAEGISERYLQKLFEAQNDNFTHYLRERRLQRAWIALSNPSEGHRPVSEVAYSCGFSDAAHFSRAFRERFGLPPKAFRQQEAERITPKIAQGQRGWPQGAISRPRTRRSGFASSDFTAAAKSDNDNVPIRSAENHHLPVEASHVHWGFFSRSLKPVIEIASGDTITVETLTQHASDDPERMIAGDTGAESVFRWTSDFKAVDRRGAGPMDASVYGRGAGEGFGVHICTGPIAVKDAQPGDVLEVHILDVSPRPSRNPAFQGRVFGSSAAAWWGYHYSELLSEPKPRETITIYEVVASGDDPHAKAVYSYRWEPQTDPSGTIHKTYDYPGVPVAPGSIKRRTGVLNGFRIPLRPHFGVIGVAPREAELVDSVPPCYFGGNIDNWRLGKGSKVYLPVSVPGALLSVGDPHAAQGDGELGGTAIECSMTGTFAVTVHKKADLAGQPFADLTYPLIETPTEWVLAGFSHPNYLAEFGEKGQSEVYAKSSLDLAMKDAFRKVRRFLMNARGLSEDEAIALISAAVDFGVTQVVDGNWGVHAILSKRLFDEPFA